MKNAEYPETAGRVPLDDAVPSSPGDSTSPSDGACAQSRPAAPVTSPDGRLTSWAAEELNAWYNERLRDADVNMGVIVRQQWELAAQLEDYRNLSFREAVCTPSRSRYIVPAHSYTRATLQGIIVGAVLAASIAGFWYAVYQVARAWL